MVVHAPCPRCSGGLVAVEEARWPSPSGERRGVWLDEPASCSGGCPLTAAQVVRLLTTAYDAPVRQLTLWEIAA